MRKVHLAVGVVVVVIFLITGQIMRHHEPAMRALGDGERLLYRSRHIYILAAGLINLVLGLYLQMWSGWRGAIQKLGSVLLIASPLLLILGFSVEPALGLRSHLWRSALGIFALFGGSIAHLMSSIGQPRAKASL